MDSGGFLSIGNRLENFFFHRLYFPSSNVEQTQHLAPFLHAGRRIGSVSSGHPQKARVCHHSLRLSCLSDRFAHMVFRACLPVGGITVRMVLDAPAGRVGRLDDPVCSDRMCILFCPAHHFKKPASMPGSQICCSS